jgi:hypothetical protein
VLVFDNFESVIDTPHPRPLSPWERGRG